MPESRTTDRHAETPLSLRLGAERERTTAAAERLGVPVRRYILDAVRERLERDESGAQTAAAPTWEALLAEALRQAPKEARKFAAALAGALGSASRG
jgi:hypothetical protein